LQTRKRQIRFASVSIQQIDQGIELVHKMFEHIWRHYHCKSRTATSWWSFDFMMHMY